ncbi:MAG: AbrB/MazE/SpoVT family DNA-binding domain-containing protein [Clostridia bacterium]|nr:AbrB/MazE/SpoVT family DNA-binding domain-containing protein [Clostridia bacterium]
MGHRNRVRRIDDLGRVVIPKEIRRTMRIREGEPLYTTLTLFDRFCLAIHSMVKRAKAR